MLGWGESVLQHQAPALHINQESEVVERYCCCNPAPSCSVHADCLNGTTTSYKITLFPIIHIPDVIYQSKLNCVYLCSTLLWEYST